MAFVQINLLLIKILGCFLEAGVPLLVYDLVPMVAFSAIFIFSSHVIARKDRVRIAVETAMATAYLHSICINASGLRSVSRF